MERRAREELMAFPLLLSYFNFFIFQFWEKYYKKNNFDVHVAHYHGLIKTVMDITEQHMQLFNRTGIKF